MSRRKNRKGSGMPTLDLFGIGGFSSGNSGFGPSRGERHRSKRPACATADRAALVAMAGMPMRFPLPIQRDGRELPSFQMVTGGNLRSLPPIAPPTKSEPPVDWVAAGLAVISGLAYAERTAEGILVLVEAQIGPPPHYNAAGPLIAKARREGYLIDTGRREKAKAKAKKSRLIPVYRCGVGR